MRIWSPRIKKVADFLLCIVIAASLTSAVGAQIQFSDHIVRYLVMDTDQSNDQSDVWFFNGFGDPFPASGGCAGCWIINDEETTRVGQRIALNSQGGNTTLEAMYSSGMEAQDETIADSGDGSPATLTFTPDKNRYVEFTCNDSDSCDITLGEPNSGGGGVEGHWIDMVCLTASPNTCDLSDTAGVTEFAGNFSMDQYDAITIIYNNQNWVEVHRSVN